MLFQKHVFSKRKQICSFNSTDVEEWPDLPPAQPPGFAAHPVDCACSEAEGGKPINSVIPSICISSISFIFQRLLLKQTTKEQIPWLSSVTHPPHLSAYLVGRTNERVDVSHLCSCEPIVLIWKGLSSTQYAWSCRLNEQSQYLYLSPAGLWHYWPSWNHRSWPGNPPTERLWGKSSFRHINRTQSYQWPIEILTLFK